MGNYKSARDTLRHEMGRKPTHEEVKARLDELNLTVPSLNATLDEHRANLQAAAVERHQGPDDWPNEPKAPRLAKMAPRTPDLGAKLATMAKPAKQVLCGNCKGYHPDAKGVRLCYSQGPVERDFSPSAILRAIADAGPSKDEEKCGRCGGTGQFITGMHNGVLTGPGGICFRCAGAAKVSDCGAEAHYERADAIAGTAKGEADVSACCSRVRNELYDLFGIRVSAY